MNDVEPWIGCELLDEIEDNFAVAVYLVYVRRYDHELDFLLIRDDNAMNSVWNSACCASRNGLDFVYKVGQIGHPLR